MTEPKRWLEEGAPGGARALLRAGLEERPSERVIQRTLIAVGATAVATSATTGVMGAAAKLVMAAKVATISVATASALLGAGVTVQYLRTTHSVAAPSPAKRAQPSRAARQPTREGIGSGLNAMSTAASDSIAPEAVPTVAAFSETASEPGALDSSPPEANPPRPLPTSKRADPSGSVRAQSADRDGTPRSRAVPFVPAADSSAIHQEIAAIDGARAQLHAGNTAAALRELDAYDRRADFARFAPEALYLRMEAQLQAGQLALAQRTAREIVQRFPHSAQVRRAAQVLESSQRESTSPVQIP